MSRIGNKEETIFKHLSHPPIRDMKNHTSNINW